MKAFNFIRIRFFSSPIDAFLTLSISYLIYLTIPPLINWALIEATFSGDTIYAWSKVLDKEIISKNIGSLKIQTLASKNDSNMFFPEEKLPENIVLDIIYSILIPIK